ncbi:MAG: carboxypeptidase-like regulatory domain-containing protein, partial [Flavobacteriales bacterium]|nr:carboxypeptidase-like regulatory domain-containing protein [Flavobacteriales bacterium]
MQAIKSAAQQSKFQALVILLIIAFISSIQLAFGQGIKGTVTDKESGEPIPFANVVVPSGSDNTLLGVATDVDGKFWIPLEAGSYDLNVSFVGYDQLEIKDIQVGKGDTLSVELLIVTSVTQLDAFVVSAEQEQLKFEKSYTVQSTVTRRELNAIRSVSPGVLASPLKALPGVVMRSAPKISIRARREKAIETPDLATLESEEALPENGGLTAGEIKDFGKWDLWNDISKKVLSFGKEQWKVDPSLRYAVQVKTTDGFPAVDYEVQLVTKTGEVIFTTHTNNAGAAELWSSLFEDQEANPIIVVLHQGVRLAEQKAILFKKGINQISIHKECEVPS